MQALLETTDATRLYRFPYSAMSLEDRERLGQWLATDTRRVYVLTCHLNVFCGYSREFLTGSLPVGTIINTVDFVSKKVSKKSDYSVRNDVTAPELQEIETWVELDHFLNLYEASAVVSCYTTAAFTLHYVQMVWHCSGENASQLYM